MASLAGKIAIITGAGQGLGRATALAFAKEGAAVSVVDVNADTARAVAGELHALGAKAIAVTCDVRHRAQADAAVRQTVAAFGTVDILINYAQIIRIEVPFENVPEADFEDSWRSGVMGSIFFMQACFPYMRGRGGKIINAASAAGILGFRNMAAYDVAKEAIRGLTKVAANDWGPHNITVNVICPQAMTPAYEKWAREQPARYQAALANVPLGRLGDAEADIGRAVVALVRPDLGFMTGATVMLDGGNVLIS